MGLTDFLTTEEYRESEELKEHTTFRVGGPADYYVIPTSTDSLKNTIHWCIHEQIPYTIIGKGSNIVFGDKGYRGVVIEMGKGMEQVRISPEGEITAQAGISLIKLAVMAGRQGFTGLEFASGIPGTLGGGVTMNAGAYGGEMKDCIVSVDVLTKEGNCLTLTKEQLDLSYRHSVILEKGYIVLEAKLKLQIGNQQKIEETMQELNARRKEKQPLEYPSAGSTFKRPEGYFAGKLIQDAGLRGYQVGGAQISEKHCGFVVNKGNATAADIVQLIEDVKQKVQEQFGVTMEPEVRLLGEF